MSSMLARRGNTIQKLKRQASLISKFCINDWKSASNILAETEQVFFLPTASCLYPVRYNLQAVLKPKYLSHGVNCLLSRWRRRVGIEPT